MEHSTLNQTAQKRNVLRGMRQGNERFDSGERFSPEFFTALVRCPLR
jgi:hypothetical protein